MSTTMLPPTYYLVKPRGHSALSFETVAEAAIAVVGLAPTPVRVSVMNGIRIRNLTDAELHSLGRHMRAYRLRSALPHGASTGRAPVVEATASG